MQCVLVVLSAALAVAGPPADLSDGTLTDPVLDRCMVSVKDDVEVPAQEPGVLVAFNVREGTQVRAGDLVGQIDDSERQMQKRLALIEQMAAKEQIENDVDVRYAEAATKNAEWEYVQAKDANRRVRGTFPEAEIRRLRLAWHRADLQIEQAKHEQKIATFTVESRAADVEATENNIRRRQIIAPIDGEVVAVFKHAGEWANPGDPVLQIVRFDTLRIEGLVNCNRYDPSEVAERPVTVEVRLARGRRMQFDGQIVYVSPLVQGEGEYLVRAEVANQRENGQWLLRPGLMATMTIRLAK